MRQLFTADELRRAAAEPPGDSRAYFRGRITQKFGEDIIAASWQSLTLRLHDTSGHSRNGVWATVAMDDARGLTRADCENIIEGASSVEELLEGLAASGIQPEYRK